jgi:hypothetical protein
VNEFRPTCYAVFRFGEVGPCSSCNSLRGFPPSMKSFVYFGQFNIAVCAATALIR